MLPFEENTSEPTEELWREILAKRSNKRQEAVDRAIAQTEREWFQLHQQPWPEWMGGALVVLAAVPLVLGLCLAWLLYRAP